VDRKNVKQLIHNRIADCMKQNGFRRYKTKLCYYRIRGDVLSFILFNTKSYGYECGAYIQPLYIPCPVLSLDYGDTVERMEWAEREKYSLWTDYSEEKLRENMENIRRYCAEKVFMWLEEIGSPQGIRTHILEERSRIFCPPVRRYEAMAYSSLYLGDMENGKRYLDAVDRELRDGYTGGGWIQEMPDETERLLRAIDAGHGEVERILRKNVEISREVLGI